MDDFYTDMGSFYIVKARDINDIYWFSWIAKGDPYSEGHTWFLTKEEAINEAHERGYK